MGKTLENVLIITTIVMFIIFYTHNQYNYPKNYQIINYSFKSYLLAEHLPLP